MLLFKVGISYEAQSDERVRRTYLNMLVIMHIDKGKFLNCEMHISVKNHKANE